MIQVPKLGPPFWKYESKKSHRNKNLTRKTGKTAKNYEDEEWRTVYIGFVERGTSSEDLAKVFKVSQLTSAAEIKIQYSGFRRDREIDSQGRVRLHSVQRGSLRGSGL